MSGQPAQAGQERRAADPAHEWRVQEISLLADLARLDERRAAVEKALLVTRAKIEGAGAVRAGPETGE